MAVGRLLSSLAIGGLVIVAAGGGQGSAPSDRDRLKTAYKFAAEKSWALALKELQATSAPKPEGEELDSPTTAAIHREIRYEQALALGGLGKLDESFRILNSLTTGAVANDRWAACAHWRLALGLPDSNERMYAWNSQYHYNYQLLQSSTIQHLREANRIFEQITDDEGLRLQFLTAVARSTYAYTPPDEKDADFVLSLIDAATKAAGKDETLLAETRYLRVLYQGRRGKLDNDKQIAEMRTVVQEFPKTIIAPRALMHMASLTEQTSLPEALTLYERIAEEYPGSPEKKSAASRTEVIRKPELQFDLPAQGRPGVEMKFVLSARNLDSATVSIEEVDILSTLKDTRRPDQLFANLKGSVVATVPASLPARKDHRVTTGTVQLPKLAAGAYVVRVKSDGARTCSRLLLASDLAVTEIQSAGTLTFWATDAITGAPQPDVSIHLGTPIKYIQPLPAVQGYRVIERFLSAKTNSDGLADLEPPTSGAQYYGLAVRGKDVAILGEGYRWYSTPAEQQQQAYIYTDRPTYRPEQKAYWKAIVRQAQDGRLLPPKDKKVEIYVQNPKYENVEAFGGNKMLSDFGSVSGEIALPADASLGQWTVSLRADGREVGRAVFQVEEYKKPEYEVKVDTAVSQAKLGQRVRAMVNAKYYQGAPVDSGEVKWSVRRQPYYVFGGRFDRWNDLGWFDAEKEGVDSNERHSSGGDIVAEGTGRLDSKGQFPVEFTADPPTGWTDSNYGNYWNPWARWCYGYGQSAFQFKIEATVIDASRRSIDGASQMVVGKRAMELTVRPDQWLLSPGDRARLNLGAWTLGGERTTATGTLFIEQRRWNATKAMDDITTIGQMPVSLDGTGRQQPTVVEIGKGTSALGRTRFVYVAQDPYGGDSSAYTEVSVADDTCRDIFTQYQGVRLTGDRPMHEVGDDARFLITNDRDVSWVLCTLNSAFKRIDRRVLKMDRRAQLLSLPVGTDWVPNVTARLYSVREGVMVQDETEVIVPPKRDVLDIMLATDKPDYRPGQTGTVEVTVRDYQGKPVATELSLSMFDDSLTYIAADAREDIRRYFYGKRREVPGNSRFSMMMAEGLDARDQEQRTDLFNYQSYGSRRELYGMALGGSVSAGDVYRDKGDDRAPRASRSLALPASAAAPMAKALQEGRANYFAMESSVAFDAVSANEAKKEKDSFFAPPPKVRSDFRDSMFWGPSVLTDDKGFAKVQVTFPDSLTRWKLAAVGITQLTEVGNQTTSTAVKKDLTARLETPRFLVEGDEVILAAIVENRTDRDQSVQVVLKSGGALADGPDRSTSSVLLQKTIQLTPGQTQRLDVPVAARQIGEATFEFSARGNTDADALAKSLPIVARGIVQTLVWNTSADDSTTVGLVVDTTKSGRRITRTIQLPKLRDRAGTRLTIDVQPSLARSLRDGLPYMIEYPYGCVEQTVSRFAPAAAASGAFQKLGLPADPLLTEKLPEAIRIGVSRLKSFQRSDGGWGWWSDDEPNAYITAVVMYSLTMARQGEAQVPDDMFRRGLDCLRRSLEKKDDKSKETWYYWRMNDKHTQVMQALVLALNGERVPKEALESLYQTRDQLTPHGLAMLVRVLNRSGRTEDAKVCLRNLQNFAVAQPLNATMHFGKDRDCWYWWDDSVEATAMAVTAFLELDPHSPDAAACVKWLVINREGNRWKSTKDTAAAVYALTEWMLARKETAAAGEFKLTVGAKGAPVDKRITRTFKLEPSRFWDFDGHLELSGEDLPDADGSPLEITVEQTGTGECYVSAMARFFNKEKKIAPAGNEVFVERVYEKVVRQAGAAAQNPKAPTVQPAIRGRRGKIRPVVPAQSQPAPTDETVVSHETFVPLKDGDELKSGDEIRVTLKLKSLNDFEYLLFEDPKPATFETVDVKSGRTWASGLCSNVELRDKHVAFFITMLRQGDHELTYRVRAEAAGKFTALPTHGGAMYAPRITANSASAQIGVAP